jgi:hypothetical protein
MDGETQEVGESLSSGGHAGTARGKERCCGTCGKIGHNMRTCQIVFAISGKEYSD